MNDYIKRLTLKRDERFTTPIISDEHPFWICSYGHTYKNKPFHEITTNTGIARIEYIISGDCVLNSKNISCIATAGDTYFLHQGDDHNYYPSSHTTVEKIWINIKGELVKELEKLYKIDDVILFKNTDSLKYIDEIHAICKNAQNPYEIQDKVSTRFFELIKFLSKSHITAQSDIDYLDNIRSYIDLHIQDKITLDDLSRFSYTSIDHTINTFKEKFGITPHQYILQSKIQLAKTLLGTSAMSIEKISEMLNFSNIGHFSNIFYKYTGLRPSKYRKTVKQQSKP